MINKINEALYFHKNNQLDKAEKIYLELINNYQENNNSEILGLLGVLYLQKNNFSKAKHYLQNSFRLNENNPSTVNNLGLLEKRNSNYEKAIYYFDLNIKKNNFLDSYINKLNLLFEIKKFSECLNLCIKFLEKFPENSKIKNIKALCFYEIGEIDKSLEAFNSLTEGKNVYLDSFFNFSRILFKIEEFKKSLFYIDQYLFLNQNPEAHIYLHRFNILVKLKRIKDAGTDIVKAYNLDKKNFDIKVSLFNYFFDNKKFNEIINFSKEFIKNENNIDDINYFKLKKIEAQVFLGNWKSNVEDLFNLKNYLISKSCYNPIILSFFFNEPKLLKRYSEEYWKNNIDNKFIYNFNKIKKNNNNKKIKLGFLSGDFRKHAIAYVIKDLFKYFDNSKFDIFAYSTFRNENDDMYDYFEKKIKNFCDISELNNQEILNLLNEHQLDILIDLSGYTKHNKCWIFKFDVAKIKINYLGYPGTMGTNCYDYILVDENVIPPRLSNNFNEKILYLPNTFFPLSVNAIKFSDNKRKDFYLPEKLFLIGSFARIEKIRPDIFDIWMKILEASENTALVLSISDHKVIENIKKYCREKNYQFEKIIFLKKLDNYQDYLARLSQLDLYLDTFPYNSHTQMSEALFQSCVPSIGLTGETYASRVSLSLLKYAGLEDLITYNKDIYFQKILYFINNKSELKLIKNKLVEKNKFLSSKIQDFSNNFQKILIQISKN